MQMYRGTTPTFGIADANWNERTPILDRVSAYIYDELCHCAIIDLCSNVGPMHR